MSLRRAAIVRAPTGCLPVPSGGWPFCGGSGRRGFLRRCYLLCKLALLGARELG